MPAQWWWRIWWKWYSWTTKKSANLQNRYIALNSNQKIKKGIYLVRLPIPQHENFLRPSTLWILTSWKKTDKQRTKKVTLPFLTVFPDTNEVLLPRSGLRFWLLEANFPHATTDQKHSPDLGSDLSPVWNFCTHDVSWRGGIAKYQLPSQAMKKIIILLLIQDLHRLGSLSGTDYSGHNACFKRIYWIHIQS